MESILTFLYRYGLVSICFIIFIEYACFPISSEVVLPFSGVIAKVNNIDLGILILLSSICGVLGSSLCYFVGYIFGVQILESIEEKFKSAKKSIEKSYEFFDKYGKYAVLIGRVIPLCRTYISFLAGALKQSYKQFVLYSFCGIIIWNSILISVGYILGENWGRVIEIYEKYKNLIIVGIIFGGIVLLAVNICRKINNCNYKNGR